MNYFRYHTIKPMCKTRTYPSSNLPLPSFYLFLPLPTRRIELELNPPNQPRRDKHCNATSEDNSRLAQHRRQRHVVRDNQLAVAEVVDQIACAQDQRRAPDRVEVGAVQGDLGRVEGG